MQNINPDQDQKISQTAKREEEVLAFWMKENIFKKSLDKSAPKGEFVFYDGPPFATGMPHYGHMLPGTIKDVLPRYKTMQGYHVPRRWGWDCHGLPVENLIEKELGLQTKKDIENLGIGKFNQSAKDAVLRYEHIWKEQIPRFGRWVDMEDDYKTMDCSYTESVWWVFKKLYEKGLIYKSFKSMHLCPRCETTLSNFEVNQGYKDITDISVYVKFEIKEAKILTKFAGGAGSNHVKTFFLAWTTTPWTLPGNVALAVGPDIIYTLIESDGVRYILAKDRLSVVKSEYTHLGEFKGADLAGSSYNTVFPYYVDSGKVYTADFVTTTDGTGIVHIAPAFGADDYNLSLKEKLPFIQHVGTNGIFKKEVTDFAGLHVKPKDTAEEKDAHQKTDIEIIKYLAGKGSLFAKEKIVHSYPHCWRCDTPLINYASSSWFVKVTDIKDKLVSENKKVNWIPQEVGQNRFGKWLEGARDWAISRSRYWGAPLPVWQNEEEMVVIGSIEDLRRHIKPRNKYIVVRHGQAENNIRHIMSATANVKHNLTKFGKEQAIKTAVELGKKYFIDSELGKIGAIYSSPFVRTMETAGIIASNIGIPVRAIKTDVRLAEINSGVFDGKSIDEYHSSFKNDLERFIKAPTKGENYQQIMDRLISFMTEVDLKHKGETILIVTHDTPSWLLFSVSLGLDHKQALALRGNSEFFIKNAEYRELSYLPLPRNEKGQLDLHRPYIDNVELISKTGKTLKRVPEVFDCWFESGSMPYGEAHYIGRKIDQSIDRPGFDPVGNIGGVFGGIFGGRKGYPADFIAEGLDQTRGWFYSMMVLGVALFGKSPYKNVIVNGLVLAEDGRKMSKRLNNYPDIMLMVNKYGADALRYFMLSSPVVRSEDLRFSEKGVDEVHKKVINRLDNVLSFYKMYAPAERLGHRTFHSPSVLDQWIVARLNETIISMEKALDNYEINNASRPIGDFIEDLSVWYIRRSRDRFKSDDVTDRTAALHTTHYVLKKLSMAIAPFMPFYAEYLFQSLRSEEDTESVHLEDWPKVTGMKGGEGGDFWSGQGNSAEIIANMILVRKIASSALEKRTTAGIKVRQPLSSIKVYMSKVYLGTDQVSSSQVKSGQVEQASSEHVLPAQFIELIKDEVNVKEVIFSKEHSNSNQELEVVLDTYISPELEREGLVRELLRMVQDKRKEAGLSPRDRATLTLADKALFEVAKSEKETLLRVAGIDSVQYTGDTSSTGAGDIAGGDIVVRKSN